IKPWNFHHYSSADWKSYYNPVTFYEWRKSHNAMREKYTPCNPSARTPITTAFSALVSTYNPERIEHLSLLIRHLLRSDKVDTVFITWHNPALKVPSSFWEAIPASEHSRVRILYQEFDSLNNRFNPVAELETEAVYILDDDVFVDLADLEFAFQVWQTRKDSVVGHFPRYHAYNASLQLGFYKIPHGEKNQYSMVLTKSMFIRSEYLFVYTCLMDPEMHQWIDERLNCEDIGFSMLASGLSGTSATVVRTQEPIIDFGLKNGISLSNGHMNERSKCIHDFIHRFWEENDPLLMVHDTVVPFQLSALRRGNWDKIESQLQAYAV
ncbi:glycosyl transferase family 64 domain-containing protein, partial [Spinellus fusiger]